MTWEIQNSGTNPHIVIMDKAGNAIALLPRTPRALADATKIVHVERLLADVRRQDAIIRDLYAKIAVRKAPILVTDRDRMQQNKTRDLVREAMGLEDDEFWSALDPYKSGDVILDMECDTPEDVQEYLQDKFYEDHRGRRDSHELEYVIVRHLGNEILERRDFTATYEYEPSDREEHSTMYHSIQGTKRHF